MKNILFLIFVLASFTSFSQIRLSDLNTKGSITGTEKIPVSGSGNPAITPNLLSSWLTGTNSFVLGSGTTNFITYWTGAGTLGSLNTATYPDLTELSYVKGVTSSIQSQLDSKLTTLNTLTAAVQTFATGTTGTDFNISSGTSTHTFNLPTASATNRGLLSTTDWSTFNGKQSAITFGTGVQTALGVNIGSAGAPVLFNGAGGTPSSLTLTNATGLPPTTGISGWPANSAGVLTNNGSGTLSWGAGSSYTFDGGLTESAGTVTLSDAGYASQQTIAFPVYSAGDFNGPYINWNIAGQDLVGFGVDSRFRMSSDDGFVFESFDSYDGTFDDTNGSLRVGFSGSLVTTFNAIHTGASGNTHGITVDVSQSSIQSGSGSSTNSIVLNSSASPNNSTAVYTDNSVATKSGITYAASGYVTADRSLTDRGYVLGAKTFTGAQTFRTSTTGAGTAPIYIPAGTLMTTPENTAIENNGTHLYYTTGGVRYQLDQQSGITSSSNVDWTGTHTFTTPPATVVSGATSRRTYTMNWFDQTGISGNHTEAIYGGYEDATITIVFKLTAVKNDGSESFGGEYAATFNLDGTSTFTQVGTTTTIFENKTDSGASFSVGVSGSLPNIIFNSGDADTYRWTIWADITITEL